MEKQQALDLISQALQATLKDPAAKAKPGSDLVKDGILDSLDGMVFLLELSGLTNKQFPENDLVELGFFNVDKLVEFISSN
jgi:acyl carrier protein